MLRVLVTDTKNLPNYDNFSSKEVESRLEGGQEDISGKTAATFIPRKKPGGGRKRATSDDAAQSEAAGGQPGEKPPTRFLSCFGSLARAFWPMLAWRPKFPSAKHLPVSIVAVAFCSHDYYG